MVDLKARADHDAPEPRDPVPSPEAISRDWITIWQSELSALATDRERQEAWSRLVAFWANTGQTLLHLFHAPSGHAEAGPAASAPPPGSASAMAASDATAAERHRQQLARLDERVAELERQLAKREPSANRA